MKHLLLALGLLLATAAHAQTTLPAPVAYCMLITNGPDFTDTKLTLDYGQTSLLQLKDADLESLNVQLKEVRSVAAALSYLYGRGWECIATTPVLRPGFNLPHSEVGYLLRRRP